VIKWQSIRKELAKLDIHQFPQLAALWKQDQQKVLSEIYQQQKLSFNAVTQICGGLEREKKEKKLIASIEENMPVNRQNEVESEVDSLTPEHYPILTEHRRVNRAWLVEQILYQANHRPNDSVGMMLASLESVLQHISPQNK